MKLLCLFLFIGLSQAFRQCQKVDTIDEPPSYFAQRQPVFFNFLPKTPENILLDNVCLTYFPLPDEPGSYTVHVARVFCDGSSDVMSFIQVPTTKGANRKGNPMMTVTDYAVAYAGCETNVAYRCSNFGEPFEPFVFGVTFICQPLSLSCLRKIEEIIKDKNLPDTDFYVLPMKLPNRCVTQQLCLLPPNPFYNQLGNYESSYFY